MTPPVYTAQYNTDPEMDKHIGPAVPACLIEPDLIVVSENKNKKSYTSKVHTGAQPDCPNDHSREQERSFATFQRDFSKVDHSRQIKTWAHLS